MRKRSRLLIGAAAFLLAGALLLVELLPRGAPARPAPPEVPPGSQTRMATAPPPPAPAPRTAPAARKASPRKKTAAVKPKKKPAVPAPVPAALPEAPEAPPAAETAEPILRIDSPSDGSVYHSSVLLSGAVGASRSSNGARAIDSLSWTIAGTTNEGTIPVSADGAFSARIPTAGLRSTIRLVIQAHAKNGRTAEKRISLRDDGKGPALVLLSPADGSLYGSTVTVHGKVSAPGDAGVPTAEVESVTWALEGAKAGGPVQVEADGTFVLQFPAVGLHGDLSIEVRAVDRNGRTSSVSAGLRERTSGPGLVISAPQDHSVYGEAVTIEGQVGDASNAPEPAADVSRLSWRAIGRPSLSGTIAWQADGKFSFSLPTDSLSDDLVVELRASDRNGHASLKALTLVPRPAAGGAGPSAPRADLPAPVVLGIEAPQNGSTYRSSVNVSGRVRPGGDEPDGLRGISVRWAVVGSSLAGTARLKDDGAFSFVVPTIGLRGTQALAVKAVPSRGPAVDATIVLYEDTRGLPLMISSPSDGGYYLASTILEGRVGDENLAASEELASLSWKIPAHSDLGGHAVVNADGSFKVALPFSDLAGDVSIAITAEDKNGHLSQKSLTLHDGMKKPGLAVGAPADGSPFGSAIRVAGRVTDPYAGTPAMAGIDSLSWLVAPTDYSRHSSPLKGSARMSADGAFRFSIPTAVLAGPQQLTVIARARNGNEAETTVRLVPGEGDVPGFTVDPADKQANMTWEKVSFAVRYDLTYGPSGGPAAAMRTIGKVSPPFTVTGLENGSLYEFRLTVGFDDGSQGSSAVARAIPLSPETLAPVVKGDYQQIRLSWKTIPGASSYDVWRSLASGSGYTKIAESVPASRYLDTSVRFGREYYYAISPSGPKAPMSAPGSGRSLAFPEDKLALIGTAGVVGACRITIDGGYAFVAAGARGVTIVDVSDPKAPVPVGRVATRDARHVAVRAEYAYVADGDAGLRVLDISNPRAPEIIGSCKTSDARAVALSGPYAYVADGARGLKVIDVSDARNLPRVAVMESTDARDVAISGSRLFLADGAGGLKILSLARPLALSLLGSLPASDARTVSVQGGTAVLADGAQGLRIVNVKNPARPVLASTFETDMAASAVTDGRFAYLTDEKGAIKVVDIKDPARPSLFTIHKVKGPVSVTVVERSAYIADSAGLDVMRIQIYGTSFRVASCETGGKAFQVTVSGPLAYVAAHGQGVRVVDVSNPSQVTDASAVASAPARYAESVAVSDQRAFVADGSSGIRIFDFRKGEAPAELGAYRTGGYVSGLTVKSSFLYAANGGLGLRILDVSNPQAPSEIGSLRTDDAHDVEVRSGVAWVADGDSGLRAIDVSDPANPRPLSRPIPGNATVLAANGSLLFVGGADGVRIFDVTDPRAPRLDGRYDSDSVGDLAAAGRYAYVAEGYRGLTVLDVSRPNQPVVVSSCADVFAMGVAVTGDYALVADSFGLQVIRVLIPDWLSH